MFDQQISALVDPLTNTLKVLRNQEYCKAIFIRKCIRFLFLQGS